VAQPSLREALELLRPRQWPKNLLLFAALLFSGAFVNHLADARACLALLAFIILSSAVYAFNDIHDADSDRLHPQKKHRPVASEAISLGLDWAISLSLALSGLALRRRWECRFCSRRLLTWPSRFLTPFG